MPAQLRGHGTPPSHVHMSPSVSVRLLLTQSDARLVQYARAGHERAFEALVQRYRRQLHGYCRRLLLSDERAEDALQQALLQAWVALRDGVEVHDVRPWLYRIVHNAAVNALRVSGYDYCTLSESLSGADAPQADLDRRIAVREALAGLAALPEMQRQALLRTAVEGRSHQQVASDLGVSEPALRGLVYRARTALRAAAGAIIPPPLLGWALDAGTRGAPALERVVGLGAGGGSAGLAGLIVKGGAVAVTAGALAGGLVASHVHRPPAHAALHAHRPHATVSAAVLGAAGSTRPVAFTRPLGHGLASVPAQHRLHSPGLAADRPHPASHKPIRRSFTLPPVAPVHGGHAGLGGDSSQRSLTTHDGGSGGSNSHDGQPESSSSGSGSGDRQQRDGGASSQTESGQDGSGDPTGQASNGGESATGSGGSAGNDGFGDSGSSESAPGGGTSTTDGAFGTKDGKDGKDGKEESPLVEGSSKG
jgi:RNA polymerase sigma factor (sigma-70 family)